MGTTCYFVIVSREDHVLFETDFGSGSKQQDDSSHLHQFILHAALDSIDDRIWDTSSMQLKVVDKFNDMLVSAFVTASRMRLMLLHDARNEDGIKAFFQEVYELVLKVQMNPFQDKNATIKIPMFDQRLRLIARKYL
mmetsp:Transcript_39982/g.76474  ORF Transcript_39982/g.76474 Transcript_39982/m.76474 type:complete len:137 (-) Transcript_39982:222-632(-)|eukprot:CAMPEP_0114234634 /NCGR_PEP_ID=MMETSP0058-20121206/5813_1 /TAXON_ID=36894 /ORGANISM="Pyramimonas parkeae, CCMP726" /LENGTH=136 /DNA_ID=CAMNT_0001346325 /DNA_START=246 /DNA_END=656 /DNA_ORIENTATION=-